MRCRLRCVHRVASVIDLPEWCALAHPDGAVWEDSLGEAARVAEAKRAPTLWSHLFAEQGRSGGQRQKPPAHSSLSLKISPVVGSPECPANRDRGPSGSPARPGAWSRGVASRAEWSRGVGERIIRSSSHTLPPRPSSTALYAHGALSVRAHSIVMYASVFHHPRPGASRSVRSRHAA